MPSITRSLALLLATTTVTLSFAAPNPQTTAAPQGPGATIPQCLSNPSQPLCSSLAALASQYIAPVQVDAASLLAGGAFSALSIDTSALAANPTLYFGLLPQSDQAAVSSYYAGVSGLLAQLTGTGSATSTAAPSSTASASADSTTIVATAANTTLAIILPTANTTIPATTTASTSVVVVTPSSTATNFTVTGGATTGFSFTNNPSTMVPTGRSSATSTAGAPLASSSSGAAATGVIGSGLVAGAVLVVVKILLA